MWDLYARINPQVVKVKELIEKREGRPVKNDHIHLELLITQESIVKCLHNL